MSSTEIQDWQDYYLDNPFTYERLDLISILLAVQIADFRNANRGKGRKASSPTEFLPHYLLPKSNKNKSLDKQKLEALAWASKYKRGI